VCSEHRSQDIEIQDQRHSEKPRRYFQALPRYLPGERMPKYFGYQGMEIFSPSLAEQNQISHQKITILVIYQLRLSLSVAN
jgi:hypothetical protein